ncbi:MAG: response regulator [Gemmatimonadetes bacterium]|nr:response regulator transcription factor [Gemmatimonadota bacterium]NIR76982.1 response regulator transcription factor [Gemmatimonadota bacterium]NIT85511.1 response regulator transcription factor [Gemmatimonadota bacterium]NIU29334.1 response regulator transcription factor [Gemmatimonadota bacterium]NIU34403.1 response regulator [Gemmatimonadota bacterium]
MSLGVLVVDDEPLARRRLIRLLEKVDDVEVVGSCAHGREAVKVIRRDPPGLVLLDVQMPGMSGFDVIAEVGPDAMPPVVFVTAHDEHALDAFEVHAVDYLLKPVHPDRFTEALGRARERIAGRSARDLASRLEALLASREDPGARPLARLQVEHRGGRRIVRVAEVERFEAAGNYVEVHLTDGASPLVRTTLSRLEEKLDPERFMRIHRSRIVNLDRVVSVRPSGSGDLELELAGGEVVRLSRSHREEFERRMGGGL